MLAEHAPARFSALQQQVLEALELSLYLPRHGDAAAAGAAPIEAGVQATPASAAAEPAPQDPSAGPGWWLSGNAEALAAITASRWHAQLCRWRVAARAPLLVASASAARLHLGDDIIALDGDPPCPDAATKRQLYQTLRNCP